MLWYKDVFYLRYTEVLTQVLYTLEQVVIIAVFHLHDFAD